MVRLGSMAYHIMLFGGSIVVMGFFWALMDPVMTDVLDIAANRSTTNATATAVGWWRDGWDLVPLLVSLLGVIMVVAGAALRSPARGVR